MWTTLMPFICAIPAVILFVPLSIYGNIKLYNHRKETFMQKRSLPIVFGLNASFISLMIVYPLTPIIFFNFPSSHISSLGFMLVWITWWILLLFLNLRNWLIYFKSHWTYNTVQLQWQQMINPNISNEKNWFIDNNKKYGTLSGVFVYFFLIHFIGFIVSMIGVFFRFIRHKTNDSSVMTTMGIPIIIVSLLIPIIFYILILYKTPRFDASHIYVHWESTIQSKLLVIAIITFLLGMIVGEMVGFYIGSSLLAVSMGLLFFLMNYISSFALIEKNMRPHKEEEYDHNVQLNDVLSHKKAVHLFMVYLTTEFSIECLLSFIEMAQFEKFILDIISKDNPLTLTTLRIEHVIKHSNVPQSLILESGVSMQTKQEDRALYEAKMKAHKLYNKYIRIKSEFEINISSLTRKTLSNTLSDKNKLIAQKMSLEELLVLFEKAKNEMKRLLNYSYFRFKNRREFEQVIKLFINKKKIKRNDNDDKLKGIEIVYGNDNDENDNNNNDNEVNISARAHLQLSIAISKSNTPKGYVNMDDRELSFV